MSHGGVGGVEELKAMASIQDYSDLLQQKKAFAHLATLMPDGTW